MAGIQEIPNHHLPEIITILANDIVFYSNWKLFCRALEFKGSIIFFLEKKDHHCSPTALIDDILAHWKSTSRNSSVAILSEKLKEIGCIASAEKVEALGTSTNSKMASTQIWFNVLTPTTFYTGRNKEMLEIEKQWTKCEECKTMMFVAVFGLGGIGKSEIAKNFAKIFYEKVKGHCIWIDSETDQTLSQCLQDLARELRISTDDADGKKKSLNILTKEIYEKISNQKCLIIFDNMESYENSILSQIVELASKKSPTILKPLILTTSRLRPAMKFFGDIKCVHLELDVLSVESACGFFSSSFNLNSVPDDKNDLIRELCIRLQNYPLAMQQAAAYIKLNAFHKSTKNLGKEIQNYLQEMEVKSKLILNHQLPQYEAVEKKTTLLTWTLTMNKIATIAEVGTSALRMMDIIAFMASDNISTEFLSNILVQMEVENVVNPKSVSNSFEVLRDHSMTSLSEQKLSIHRLVQEVTRIQLIEKGKLTFFLHKLLSCIDEMLADNEIPGDQMIHIETIWEHASKDEKLVRKHEGLPSRICNRFMRFGKYRELYDFSCRSASTVERILGERNRGVLRLKHWKGTSLQNLGKHSEALVVFTKLHEKQKELLGEEDRHCLEAANRLGLGHFYLKNYEEALVWFKTTMAIRERIFGKECQDLLPLKNNIALVLSAQGKHKEAKELNQEILEIEERVKGVEHRHTLSTKRNLAGVIYQQGEYEEALKMFQEVLQMQERVLGVDHPYTLGTKKRIADTYKSLGWEEEALQIWKEVMEKSEKVLGPQHPKTLNAKRKFQNFNFGN